MGRARLIIGTVFALIGTVLVFLALLSPYWFVNYSVGISFQSTSCTNTQYQNWFWSFTRCNCDGLLGSYCDDSPLGDEGTSGWKYWRDECSDSLTPNCSRTSAVYGASFACCLMAALCSLVMLISAFVRCGKNISSTRTASVLSAILALLFIIGCAGVTVMIPWSYSPCPLGINYGPCSKFYGTSQDTIGYGSFSITTSTYWGPSLGWISAVLSIPFLLFGLIGLAAMPAHHHHHSYASL